MNRYVKTLKLGFQKMIAKNWDTVYIFVDMHETVVLPTWSTKASTELYPKALETLQLMSAHPNVKLFIYSSSLPHINEQYIHDFGLKGVKFWGYNSNPYEADTSYADFKTKPYMSLILDDKGAFMPYLDWEPLHDYFVLLKALDLLQHKVKDNGYAASFLDSLTIDLKYGY